MLTLSEVGSCQRITDRRSDGIGRHVAFQVYARQQDRDVHEWQDRIVADIGVDTALHVELRGADRRGTDPQVWVDDGRQAERVAAERIADCLRERQAEVTEIGLLALEDVLRDAAGEHQRLRARA